jgi:hypothetical protein
MEIVKAKSIGISTTFSLFGIILLFLVICFYEPHGMMESWVWKAEDDPFYKN